MGLVLFLLITPFKFIHVSFNIYAFISFIFQSFVKKVATKVTDLLPQRLWISKWFNTSQNDEDILEDNENPEEVESEEDIQKPPPIKRPCIRMDVSHPPGTFSIQPRTKSTINKASPSKQQYFIHDQTVIYKNVI